MAGQMRGRTLGELADSRWSGQISSAANKGGAGNIVERYFGIQSNNEQAPDFVGAGIELKVSPLVMDGRTARRIKERTSVTMIDYELLDRESWATASLRKKLQRILFVFYEWRPDVPLRDLRVRAVKLWSPPAELLPYLKHDWVAVWTKNRAGRAHELSEADGLILGAATKGATGAMKPQPHSPEPAKSRAWSLKPRLTWTIYATTQGEDLDRDLLARLSEEAGLDPIAPLLAQVEGFVGLTVQQVAERSGISPDKSKNRAVTVVRRAIGLYPIKLPPELEALGVEVKTIPLGPNAEPYEAMSFPAFDHREMADEEWEDSELLSRVQNMLLIPLYRETRGVELLEQRVCKPFQWSPDREQLTGIRLEWERYRDLVAQGRADELHGESDTRFIHVRTHGRDGDDQVEAPGGLVVAKKSFWLNREFVRELVLSHNTDWQGF